MSQDLKYFRFILGEHRTYRFGFGHKRAWRSRQETFQHLREAASHMIGLGIDPTAQPHQYRN
jgi:hypothetical protein